MIITILSARIVAVANVGLPVGMAGAIVGFLDGNALGVDVKLDVPSVGDKVVDNEVGVALGGDVTVGIGVIVGKLVGENVVVGEKDGCIDILGGTDGVSDGMNDADGDSVSGDGVTSIVGLIVRLRVASSVGVTVSSSLR